jgi:hypothetical protein
MLRKRIFARCCREFQLQGKEQAMSQQGLKYDVDIVLCIDATGSMSPVIDMTKAHALRFYEDLQERMARKGKEFSQLRIRVIEFRDIFVDGEKWLTASSFHELPAQTDAFANAIKSIGVHGGGDEPESGLEALAMAMKSDWCSGAEKRRHVILVWTDASAHPLEKAVNASSPLLPKELPKGFDQLADFWEQHMNRQAKRLLLFAPDAYPWTDMGTHWDYTLHFPSKAGEGMGDVDYEKILSVIVESI